MSAIRVLIADDHALVREGTRRMLEQEADMQVVGEAGDGEETVKLACELKPDVAIVDIAMPKLDGIEATKQIKQRCPSVTILILSAYDDDQFIFSLLEAGAAGYLLKSIRSRELVDAVRAVHAGESVLHPSIAKKVLNRFVPSGGKPQAAKPVEVLSDRGERDSTTGHQRAEQCRHSKGAVPECENGTGPPGAHLQQAAGRIAYGGGGACPEGRVGYSGRHTLKAKS
jgi:DNA-binding NarL/FixJ family response regulator